jgi:hypothetical protein
MSGLHRRLPTALVAPAGTLCHNPRTAGATPSGR